VPGTSCGGAALGGGTVTGGFAWCHQRAKLWSPPPTPPPSRKAGHLGISRSPDAEILAWTFMARPPGASSFEGGLSCVCLILAWLSTYSGAPDTWPQGSGRRSLGTAPETG
jgi:hypothetical protein